jgi:hypothetical protein
MITLLAENGVLIHNSLIYSFEKPAKRKITKKNTKAPNDIISYSFKYEAYQSTIK